MKLFAYQEQLDSEVETMSTTVQKSCEIDLHSSPKETVGAILQRNRVRVKPERHSDEDMEGYTTTVVNAIRSQNMKMLQELLEDGTCFDACNSNGEYLIHLACRRADLETIRFLVVEGGVDVNVRDDMGRTILHDVCWRPKFEAEIMSLLLKVIDPTYLMMEDIRGHTPFDYCRRNDWPRWNLFLRDHNSLIQKRMNIIA